MSDNNPSEADPFGQIADEFVEAFRQGKRPSVEEFARRYPAHAEAIRDMLRRTSPLMAAAGVGVGAPEETPGTEPEVLESVKLLLKLGADVNAVDDDSETAMRGAAYRNHPKVVQLLADRGAKIEVWNKANKTRLTPLVIAEGHRPGLNFRPSPETGAALHRVMLAAGVTPPKSSPRPPPKSGYDDVKQKRKS